MNKFKVSIIQNHAYNNKKSTLARVKDLMEMTTSLYKPNLIVLPELFNTPLLSDGNYYPFAEYEEDSETINMLSKIAKERKVYIIGGSIPIKIKGNTNKVYNTCFAFNNEGEIKTTYRKIHLFDVNMPNMFNQESDCVVPGNHEDLFKVFETPFAKFGIGICYDIRFYEHIHLLKLKHNIDCMVYPVAFSLPTGELSWDILRRMRALDNQVYLILASQARNYFDNNYFQVYGYSSIVSPFGKVINSASYEEAVITSEIDLSQNKKIAEQIPTWKQKRSDLYEIIVKH